MRACWKKQWWGEASSSLYFPSRALKTLTNLKLKDYLSCCPFVGVKWKANHLKKKRNCLMLYLFSSLQTARISSLVFSVILPCQSLPIALMSSWGFQLAGELVGTEFYLSAYLWCLHRPGTWYSFNKCIKRCYKASLQSFLLLTQIHFLIFRSNAFSLSFELQ